MKKITSIIGLCFLFLIACTSNEEPEQQEDASFFRSESPVYQSPFGLAADPSVVVEEDSIFMYYSAEGGIAVVFSLDNGVSWKRPNNSPEDYIALERRPEAWDNTLETAEVLKVDGEYKMYYTGYREGEGDNAHIANYEIGLAVSQDGIHFTRVSESMDQPIVSRDVSNVDTYDRHAMTSPGIVAENGQYYMVYAGWNVHEDWTGVNAGIRILGATSSDGLNWVKMDAPILVAEDVSYSPDVNEASLIKADDGFWYIPFSTDKSIGLARSNSFAGPYDVFPEAIVAPAFDWDSEVTAPDGVVENGKMRLWFHGVKEPNYWPWVIGYTEAEYPLDW